MRTLFVTILVCLFQLTAASQSVLNYSSLMIPDSLKKGADAVYQLEENVIEILSPSKMKFRIHTIVTVLTKAGLRHSVVRIPVDKLMKLEEVSVKVYNDFGVEISRFKKKDFKLEGAFDGISLATDNKLYELDFPVPGTPCTIETEYELNMTGFIDVPSWYFGSTKESFKKSRFVVKSAIPVNHKTYNFNDKPVVTTEDKKTVYTWELTNRPVPTIEPGSYGASVSIPMVDVSPSEFSYDGYPGSLETWNEFGKWTFPFYEEVNPFKPERVEFFKSLVKDATTEQEKIGILYRYMQKEFRYVSIQFGIGGFKPFPVAFAEQKKYGDCKGLTHYMKNMLQSVGIPSHAALINAGTNEYPIDPSFASSIFNHVILCVPLKNDSMWLECTSKDNIPGILGPFTENRFALLLTKSGGIVAKTPSSKSHDNRWHASTEATLFEDGGAILTSRLYVSGKFWDYINEYVNGSTKEESKRALVQAFGYKTPDDLEVKILADSADGHLVNIKLAYTQFFDFKAGSKHFYPQRQYKLNDETIKPAETRQYDFLFDYPYIKTDEVIYKLPAGFSKESIPVATNIKNEYVRYNNKLDLKEETNELHITTELQLYKHIIPSSKFKEVAESFEAIKKDESQKLVLRKG